MHSLPKRGQLIDKLNLLVEKFINQIKFTTLLPNHSEFNLYCFSTMLEAKSTNDNVVDKDASNILNETNAATTFRYLQIHHQLDLIV